MSTPQETVTAYMKAFEAADAAAVARLFTDDGAVIAPPMPTIRGRREIETTMAAVFGAIRVGIEDMALDRVRQVGDAAFVEGHSREAVTDLADGTVETHRYRELFCLEREGGDWKIASYMFNTEPS